MLNGIAKYYSFTGWNKWDITHSDSLLISRTAIIDVAIVAVDGTLYIFYLRNNNFNWYQLKLVDQYHTSMVAA